MPSVYDVCAVGHITRDRVRTEDQVREQPGGAAYYLSLVLRRLGRQVAVVTKMAPADELLLLMELKTEKIDVSCTYSRTTTTFENIYPHRNSDLRVHKVNSVAAPFSPTDLSGVRARFFHLGPLTTREMSLEFLRAVSAKGDVSLDVQGLVRSLIGNEASSRRRLISFRRILLAARLAWKRMPVRPCSWRQWPMTSTGPSKRSR